MAGEDLPQDMGNEARGTPAAKAAPADTELDRNLKAFKTATCAVCGGPCYKDFQGKPTKTKTGKLYVKCKDKGCGAKFDEEGGSW
jgi:hypothetical protein